MPNPRPLENVTLPGSWPSSEECDCAMCRGARLIRAGTDAELRAGIRELVVERRADGSQRFVVRTHDDWSVEVTQAVADRIMRARDASRPSAGDEAGVEGAPLTATSIEAMEQILRTGRTVDATLDSQTGQLIGIDPVREDPAPPAPRNPEEVLRARWPYAGSVTDPVGQTFEDAGAEYKVTGGVLIGTGRPASRRLRVIAKNLATGAEKTFEPSQVGEALMPQARNPSRRGGTPRRRPARRPPAPRPTWYVVEPAGRVRRLGATFEPGDACGNIREYIGGYANRGAVSAGGGFVWMNEDGIVMGLAHNPLASDIYGRGNLVGTVVVEVTGAALRERLEAARRRGR